VKLFYSYVKPEANGAMLESWSQLNLQTQFFVF
jgi:hypothetical protein